MKKLPVYEMMIDEDIDSDLQVDFVALVDRPAIKKDFVKFNDQFVEPSKGEGKDAFIPRCISYVVNEGKDADLNTIISASKRFPMMSEYQVVIVKEAQNLKEQVKRLIKYGNYFLV